MYSREILRGLAAAHPEIGFLWWYRPQRYRQALRETRPDNVRRRLLIPRGADLFHGMNQRLPTGRLGRTVVTFHDLFVLTGEYSTPDFRERFTQQARDAARRADAIIAVSEFTRQQVVDLLGIPAQRVRVVHHGVTASHVSRGIDEEPAPREVRPTVLTVGAIQMRKNTARLVEAFESLDDSWRLVLAGSSGYGAAAILAQIAKSPARNRIEVLGYVSPAELAELYRSASIFAFPSLDEGFGMPVLEAMAARVPVITSNRSALPEVAGDAALLIDPEDTEALRAGMRKLAEDSGLRKELAERGLARATTFSWEKAVRETWSVYRELLG